jgi:adenylate/nucleoside-diphosphate kinase
LESFVEGIKGEDSLNPKVVVVEPINTDISAEYVHIKILDKIKNHMQHRTDLIEREQAQILKATEVKNFEASYTYRHSKFGRSSPLSPFNPCKTKEFAVLYRERVYFLSNKAEQAKFLLEPSKFTLGREPVPIDIEQRPSASVIGLPASGKSTLASIISSKTGMVHLRPEEVIEFFITKESHFSERLRHRVQIQGSEIDDTTLIDML